MKDILIYYAAMHQRSIAKAKEHIAEARRYQGFRRKDYLDLAANRLRLAADYRREYEKVLQREPESV